MQFICLNLQGSPEKVIYDVPEFIRALQDPDKYGRGGFSEDELKTVTLEEGREPPPEAKYQKVIVQREIYNEPRKIISRAKEEITAEEALNEMYQDWYVDEPEVNLWHLEKRTMKVWAQTVLASLKVGEYYVHDEPWADKHAILRTA